MELIDTLYFWFAYIAFIGLMGGASNSNCLYMILTSDKLTNEEKELGMMMCTIFNDFGVLIGAIIALVLSET